MFICIIDFEEFIGCLVSIFKSRPPDEGLRRMLGLLPNQLILGYVAHLVPLKIT